MRLFNLNRTKDESGVSGTGIVAHGVQFNTGKCAVCWEDRPFMPSSIGVYDSMDDVEKIHGHDGKTVIEWITTEKRDNAIDALAEAVRVIYFGDNSDYCSSLWKIVILLGGDEAAELLENDEQAAYERYVKT